MSTLTLTVRRHPDGWTVTHTSTALVSDVVTVTDPADIRDVLSTAEEMASGDVLWRANACGFDAVIDVPRPHHHFAARRHTPDV
jgi:hypothetical protein